MNRQPLRILLVEDDLADARLLRETLADTRSVLFEVTQAQCLSEALHLLAVERFDAVLLDLFLSDSHGLETFATLHTQAPNVPIVVLTGLDNETVAVEAVQGGAQDYLVKGQVEGHVLVRALRYAIERKRLQEQLRQSQKMEAIGTLAGGIAHDFNNILAAILGYTEMATYDVPPNNPAQGYLRQVLTAGNRAKDLVQQILTFSRRSQEARRPVQLHSLVQEALTLLRASFPSTIEIQQHLSQDAGVVLADATQLHQVLMNLCANAEYAMRETGGVLAVRLEAVVLDTTWAVAHPDLTPGPYVRLTVQDTGSGIAPDVLKRIFEPFFTTKGPTEGTGMGLAVVYGIITSHGGTITVSSVPGQGATFEVYLPQMQVATTDSPHAAEPLPTGQERLLLVEDETAVARVGQALLERLGYEVVVCLSGGEALEAFRAAPQRFDLVITDQTMPRMTGDALASALRRIRPDIPIILCTGFSYPIDATKAAALSIDAWVTKPWAVRTLAHTIRQVLQNRRA